MLRSLALARPLAALALTTGLLAPSAPALAAGTDSKIYAGAGCHVDLRKNDDTSVDPTTSILRNNWDKAVTVTCPIVRDTEGSLEFADLHVLGDVECTIYARTPQNGVTFTHERDRGFQGFVVGNESGKRFTFFGGPLQGFVAVGDSLALNCVMQPKGAIIQYSIEEIE